MRVNVPCAILAQCPRPFQGQYRREAILDQSQHRLTRTLPPVVTGVIGILTLLAMCETVKAADHVI